jgi:hypothetical protein
MTPNTPISSRGWLPDLPLWTILVLLVIFVVYLFTTVVP